MAASAEDRQVLLWALWDGVNARGGMDVGTKQVMQKLADELGVALSQEGG